MTSGTIDGNLFIVDNSVSNWTGKRYLEEWSEIAKSIDIATGYFDIGSLLSLDGKWQKLDKIRILMGSETTQRTRRLILDAVNRHAIAVLDGSIEATKETNPFLNGVPSIIEALKSGQIECRIYDLEKFHAKTYITHAKLEVVGSKALVGSSNFTTPGLTKNIELNVQIQSPSEVGQLQNWFNLHWEKATDVTHGVITTIERHTRLYSPFDVYTKALYEFFRGHELTANEWDDSKSKMFPKLDRYQKEAYWALMKIARQHGGAFLCDGVGLGKTFVGLMLIERLILHEGKRVVLFAPKGAKEDVWVPHLSTYLPHIGGVSGGADFSNLAVFSHTDFGRGGDFPLRFNRISELADVVIIDEAHHFRNPGRAISTTNKRKSRYFELYDLLDNTVRQKTLFLLTATPINNRLADFRHMTELFTRRNDAFFARTIGVNNLTAHFNTMEKNLRQVVGHDVTDVSEVINEATGILDADDIFKHLVVQRSRAYARESQMKETGKSTVFPERKAPQVADYSIRKTYGRLLDMFEKAFEKETPLFTLPMYYPLAWYKGTDESIDPLEQGRQKQVVGLIRTNFLKRFESSVVAFELSCDRLMRKLLAFIMVNSESESEKKRYERWKAQNAEMIGYANQRQLEIWGGDSEESQDEDIISEELLESIEKLDRADFDVSEMLSETFLDLDEISKFLMEARKFKPKHDDKIQKLIRLLKTKELFDQKVLIFTEFADTARYLKKQLITAGIDGVSQIDSATKGIRSDIIKGFSPYYNRTTSPELVQKKQKEIRILISTDVLSEGLNLQDASRMINYDIHWNPVRLMQRIGRVDRRLNPEIEERLIIDHPEVASSRGKVSFWNFLPPEDLNKILTLYTKVTQKTLLISKTLGIEGKKLLTPQDDYDALRDFNHAYEGTKSAIEEMHLEYQELLRNNPDLEIHFKQLPGSIYSGRTKPAKGLIGVFLCYCLPALDNETDVFTEEAGTTRWYFYEIEKNTVILEPGDIISSIRSSQEIPRICVYEQSNLIEIRKKVENQIKNTYLKRVNAPIGVKPVLRCWMEINKK